MLQDPFVVACTKDHPLAKRRKVHWEELGQHSYITLAQGSGNRLQIDLALAQGRSQPRWFCEVHHVPALVRLIEAGLGVGVVPRLAMPRQGHPTLVSVALHEPDVSRTLGLIKRRGRALTPAARYLYDLLVQAMR